MSWHALRTRISAFLRVLAAVFDRALRATLASPSVRAFLIVYASSTFVLAMSKALRSRWIVAFTSLLFIIEVVLLPIDLVDGKLDNEPNEAVAAFIDKKLAQPVDAVQPWKAFEAFRDYAKPAPVPLIPPGDPILELALPIGLPPLPTPALCPTVALGGCELPFQRASRQATVTACVAAGRFYCGGVGAVSSTPLPVATPAPTPSLSFQPPSASDQIKDAVGPFLRSPGALLAAGRYMIDQGLAGWLLLALPLAVTAGMLLSASRSSDFNLGFLLLPSGVLMFVLLTVGLALLLQLVLLGAFWLVSFALGLLGVIKLLEFGVHAPVRAAELVENLYATVGAEVSHTTGL